MNLQSGSTPDIDGRGSCRSPLCRGHSHWPTHVAKGLSPSISALSAPVGVRRLSPAGFGVSVRTCPASDPSPYLLGQGKPPVPVGVSALGKDQYIGSRARIKR